MMNEKNTNMIKYVLVRDSYSGVDGRTIMYQANIPAECWDGRTREEIARHMHSDLAEALGLGAYQDTPINILIDSKNECLQILIRSGYAAASFSEPCRIAKLSVTAPAWSA